ncbi:MAG: hypothetical protein HOA21_06465, partial [Rhodospirillaceae bacterium]|nr:hypothetical protein [Rhodospirillaceae bacterium]
MPLSRLEILSREPYENGQSFGAVGPYERIEAIAHYTADPLHAANAGVVDLDLAPRDNDGLVHYSGDVTILRPLLVRQGNRALL